MVDFCIDEVYSKDESFVLIANFLNGYPADNFEDHECEVLQHKVSGKKCIASEINKVVYAGEECDEPLGKTLLLARNRKTGKVKLLEVGNVELRPQMKSVVEETEHETSYIDLGRKFGSKKHKKMLEQNEKLKVNEEVVMEQLKNVSQNISQDQLDLSAYNKTDSEDFYIPPINREANSIEDVYMISAVLTEEQYETIFQEIDNTEYKSGLFPYIKEIFSDNWSKEKTVLAVYASTLLNLFIKIMREINSKNFVACPYSETLDKIVMKEFFAPNSGNSKQRLRPMQYKDKAVCHAIVFLYLINNYKIDIESFSKHINTAERTVNLKISMTGGWPTKQGNKKIAILKLPLNKASSGFSRRKSTK